MSNNEINTEKNKFNLAEFNKAFESASRLRLNKQSQIEQDVLDELNKPETPKYPLDRSISEIIIGIKDTIMNIFSEVLQFQINSDILLKEHRLFYLGILIILIVSLIVGHLLSP